MCRYKKKKKLIQLYTGMEPQSNNTSIFNHNAYYVHSSCDYLQNIIASDVRESV